MSWVPFGQVKNKLLELENKHGKELRQWWKNRFRLHAITP
jgi:hypothetical protein